jgi:hypothetical protein
VTHQEIKELAGHRAVSPWVMKLVGDAIAKERDACANICYELMCKENPYERWEGMKMCMDKIKARGNK